jgi:hypothetical protein
LTPHLPYRELRGLSIIDQIEQGDRCPCGGSDDYCPCQNVADRETLRKWIGHNVASRLAYALANGEIGR